MSPVPKYRVGCMPLPGPRCSRRSSGFKFALPQAVLVFIQFHTAELQSRAGEELSIPDGFDSIFPTIRDFRISSPATLIFKSMHADFSYSFIRISFIARQCMPLWRLKNRPWASMIR
jgi:hypothetical protein